MLTRVLYLAQSCFCVLVMAFPRQCAEKVRVVGTNQAAHHNTALLNVDPFVTCALPAVPAPFFRTIGQPRCIIDLLQKMPTTADLVKAAVADGVKEATSQRSSVCC